MLDDEGGTGYAGAVYARDAAVKLGFTIAGSATWNPSARSYRGLAEPIASMRADAVILSGCICSNGPRLVADLRAVLAGRAILIGTDNFIDTVGFIHTHRLDGLYVSNAGLQPARSQPPAARCCDSSCRASHLQTSTRP